MNRVLLMLSCCTLLASACSAPHSPAAAAASRFGGEQVTSPRRHTKGMASLRALGHRLPHEKLRPLAIPDVVGQTAEDPNKGPAGLTYNRGPMLESPEVYAVFWGKSVAPAIVAGMPPFFENAFGSATKLMAGINEYDATTPYTIGGVSYRGSYVDADAPMGTSHTIGDLDIQIELTRLLDQGRLPPPDGHSIFMIYFPPGLTIDQGGGTLSCDVFCAYHSSFLRNGGYVYYGVMPDETEGTCAQSCGAGTPLDNEYSTSSHELIEAITDPAIGDNSLAWYDLVDTNDAIGGEVADICVNWGGTSNGYTVQTMWSNESNSCRAGKSAGFAQVAIGLDDKAAPADVSGGAAATVTVPITLTVPATGGAAGPFTLATFLDSSMTPAFNPTSLAGSGSATLTLSVPAGTHSQTLSFEVDAEDADGAHHWGVGQVAVTGPAPTVTSYTPNSGPANGGTQVTVTGSNWGLGSTVTLCDPGCNTPVPGGYVAGTKGQTVQLTTPGHAAGAVTFQLANANDAGHAQSIDFTYTAGTAPTIASTDPAAGPSAGGNLVVIDGASFSNNATVSIDGTALVPLQSMEVVDDKTILVIMPAAKGGEAAPSIVVTNGDKSATAAYTGYAYTSYPNPAPTIASMSASTGPTTGGTYVELTGSFATPATVDFGGAQAKVLTQSQSFLTMRTPAHAAGMVPVTVIASDSQKVSAAMSFTYVTSAAPSIASITPGWGATAGGTPVVIDGTSFDPNALVTVDGTPAPVVSGSNTSLTITTPEHAAGSVKIAVKNGDGQTAAGTFLYSDTAPADMAVAPDLATTGPDLSDGGRGGHGGCAMAGGGTPAGPMALLLVAALLALGLRRLRSSGRSALAASMIASILMSAPGAAADDFTMCKDIRKGDIAACKTKAAIACTEGDDWQRHNCEGKLGPSFDECNGPRFSQAVATAKAIVDDATHADMADNPSSAELQPWIARANRIEAEVAEYARLAGEWKPCGEGPFSDDDAENVRAAVAKYQHEYRSEIDYVLENSNREMKSEGVDQEEGKPGFEMGAMWKEKIATLQELSAKLPMPWRYKEAELKSALARSHANGKALAGWVDAQIAATSCPAGKPVSGSFLATLRREFASDRNVKRRVFRQTAARYVSRDGLISRDNVPVALCTEWARQSHRCETTNVTIYREKPPGGAWTSWRLAVGGGEEFNCRKF